MTKRLRFIDLFAGIGGFRVALEKRGLECVFSSEINKYSRMCYEQNFNETISGDIKDVKTEDIPIHDILCAGFPCQSFSINGYQKGFKDSRGQLFFEIIRIAEYHKPSVLLLENVKNLLSIDNGKTIREIITRLEDIGYSVHYFLLNSSYFGVPQRRERVYFVCLRKESGLFYDWLNLRPAYEKVYLKDILDENPDESLFSKRSDFTYDKQGEFVPKLGLIRIGFVGKGNQGERIYHPNGHARTLISGNGGGISSRTELYNIDGKVRVLSINECKRIMGFDDNHITHKDYKGYQQLGNAVIPKMVLTVFDNIKGLDKLK